LTEPGSCGIGGDGSGRAPAALTLDKVRELGISGREIPFLDINSVTVPGCAALWCDTLELLGGGKLTMKDVLAPAIRMAEAGCVPLLPAILPTCSNSP